MKPVKPPCDCCFSSTFIFSETRFQHFGAAREAFAMLHGLGLSGHEGHEFFRQRRGTGMRERPRQLPAQFLARFATAQGLPAPGAPRARLFGDKWAEALLKTSIKASNGRIKEALGWTPQYPEYGVGIDHVLLMWRAMMTVKP